MPYGATELVGLPDDGPTSTTLVKASLKITDDGSDDELDAIVEAVNTLVRSWPVSQAALNTAPAAWPGDVVRGATMLAGRLFRRRNSPAGVEAFGSLGAAYVMRTDPDIAMLLKLGSWTPGQVG